MPGFCSAQLRQSLFLQHLSSEVMGFSRAGSCSFSLHCLHLPSGVSLMRDHPLNGSSFRCLPTEFYCMESSLGAGRGWWAHSKQVPLTRPSVQFSSVPQFYPTLCNPMDCSTPGLPVHHQLPEFAQTHVHQVSDAIQPSISSIPSPPAFNLSQHQGLFK